MSRPDIPVTISGDDSDFRSAMERIRRATKTSVADIASSLIKINMAMGGVTTVAAALGLPAVIGATQAAVTAINEVGRSARTAGVSFETFQELKYAADQNLIGVDALTDGLKEMQLRADEFVKTGGGPAAESFARLGMNAADVTRRLKDPAQMLDTIIERVRRLDSAAQIRVLDELFGGTAAEQFTQFLSEGARGITTLQKEARDFGIVMDEDFLRKSEEAQRRFNALATIIGTNVKGALVSAADSLFLFLDGWREYQNQQASTLKDAQIKNAEERLDLENKILEIRNRDGLSDRQKTFATNSLDNRLKELQATDAKITEALSNRISERPRPVSEDWKPIDVPKPGGAGGGRSRSAAASAAEKEKKAYDEVIRSLNEEIALIGQSEIAKETVNELRRAGVEAASAEGQEISRLVALKAQEEAAEDAVRKAREKSQEAAELLGRTLDEQLENMIRGTFDARDAARSLLRELINLQTDGKGIFGSIFSSLFGGKDGKPASGGLLGGAIIPGILHEGGIAGRDGYGHGRAFHPSLFSKARRYHQGGFAGLRPGEVPAILEKGERVIAKQEAARSLQRQAVHVTVGVSADNNGNLMPFVESVSDRRAGQAVTAGLRQYDRGLPGRISDVMERNG